MHPASGVWRFALLCRTCFSLSRRDCIPPGRHWPTLAKGRLKIGRRLRTCPTTAWCPRTLGFWRVCGQIAPTLTFVPRTPRETPQCRAGGRALQSRSRGECREIVPHPSLRLRCCWAGAGTERTASSATRQTAGSDRHRPERRRSRLARHYARPSQNPGGSGRFEVRVTEEFRGAGADTLAPYDVVLLNYYDGNRANLRWGEGADNALLNFVRGGKGLVLYHFSLASFAGWTEFEKMCAGNWRQRQRPSLRAPRFYRHRQGWRSPHHARP